MQKGEARAREMSIIEFNEKFCTKKQCREHLFKMRFAKGFVCPKCEHTHGVYIKTRNLMQCAKCKYQLSATSGTIMDKTKTEIRKWYYAIYLMTVSKRGISAKELQRQISVTYKTAWYIHKRIREAIKNAEEKLLLCQGKSQTKQTKSYQPTRGSEERAEFLYKFSKSTGERKSQ